MKVRERKVGADMGDYRNRPGARVAKRRRCKAKVGTGHKVTSQDTIKWFKNRFEGIVR
jgi:large subunit ribosomal protein L11e